MLLLNVNSEAFAAAAPGATDVLLALCVNLAWSERAAQLMAAEGRLRELLLRAFRYRNTMLMKLVRNLSNHTVNKPLFIVSIFYLYLIHQVVEVVVTLQCTNLTQGRNQVHITAVRCILTYVGRSPSFLWFDINNNNNISLLLYIIPNMLWNMKKNSVPF